METLKYKLIKTSEQYNEYCNVLEKLTDNQQITNEMQDEIDLLTFLIESWDNEHDVFNELDPIEILKYLMKENKLSPKDLGKLLNIHHDTVTNLLHYKIGFSKEMIKTLAAHFKLTQDAFNRPYKLKLSIKPRIRNASFMNTKKEMDLV